MFFENRDDIHIFERIVSQLKNHTILPSSNLVRNDESYFTFSPFQDTEQFFIKKSLNSGIKKQFCVRYINKLDLTNPLCLNSQLTITIQNYNRINQVSEMEKIIKIISKIINKSLIIEVSVSIKEYFHNFNGSIRYTSDVKKASLPDVEGEHYYLRLYTDYYDEKIVVGNFLLVDFNKETNISQLDSIFFQERIGMIQENVEYIFQRKKYHYCYQLLKSKQLEEINIHRLLNDFITISTLFENNILPTAKGIGSELSRKIKDLFIYSKYYCNLSSDELIYFYNEFLKYFKIAKHSERLFSDKINKIKVGLKNNINSIKNMNSLDWEYYHNTYGIPKEYFGIMDQISITDYNFRRA